MQAGPSRPRLADRRQASKGHASLDTQRRRELFELAVADLPLVGTTSAWLTGSAPQGLCRRWPGIRFQVWDLNGADDVARYKKWTSARAQVVIGREGAPSARRADVLAPIRGAGFTEAVMAQSGAYFAERGTGSARFVIGPQMPDISATAARDAIRRWA